MPRLPTSTPTVSSAVDDLTSAVGHLVTAVGRWVVLQPTAQQAPVYLERMRRASTETAGGAGAWAGDTAARVRDRGADVASATRTQMINVGLVALLLWWVDRLLTADD